jgi:hypothetical protein
MRRRRNRAKKTTPLQYHKKPGALSGSPASFPAFGPPDRGDDSTGGTTGLPTCRTAARAIASAAASAVLVGAIDAFAMDFMPGFIEHGGGITAAKPFRAALGQINREPLCHGERLVAIVHRFSNRIERLIVNNKPEAIMGHRRAGIALAPLMTS